MLINNIIYIYHLSMSYRKLSQEPGLSIDPNTWEVEQIDAGNVQVWIIRPWSYTAPKFSQESIDLARATTSILCENIIARITQWKRVQRWNNRGSDIVLPDGTKIEAKVWRIGNSAVIKKEQMMWGAHYYGLTYYRTENNHPPSYFTSRDYINPAWELLRRISIEVALILPVATIIYYYNTAPVKKWIISKTGIEHKPLALSRARALLDNPEIPWERFESMVTYWRHTFPVKSIDFIL